VVEEVSEETGRMSDKAKIIATNLLWKHDKKIVISLKGNSDQHNKLPKQG